MQFCTLRCDRLQGRLWAITESPYTHTIWYVEQDARADDEYKVSKIAGATQVDADNVEKGLAEAIEVISNTPAEQPVVLYCSVGYRSSLMAEKLIYKAQSNGMQLVILNYNRSFVMFPANTRGIVVILLINNNLLSAFNFPHWGQRDHVSFTNSIACLW